MIKIEDIRIVILFVFVSKGALNLLQNSTFNHKILIIDIFCFCRALKHLEL